VSIIIGIVCKEAIVLASDSQTTWGSQKRTDTQKIHPIKFKDAAFPKSGTELIANSGDASISQRVVEITQSICATQNYSTDYRQLAENTQKAAAQVRLEIMEPYRNFGTKPEDFESLFNQHSFSLLMASYRDFVPHLFALDFPPGIASLQKQYAAVGCGSNLAMFLLSWFDFSKMNLTQTVITAAFIIAEVKKADAYCSGDTQISYVRQSDESVSTFIPEVMLTMEKQIELGVRKYKGHWGQSISEIADKIIYDLKLTSH
jgi:20S proteasome alpha/beta subunit